MGRGRRQRLRDGGGPLVIDRADGDIARRLAGEDPGLDGGVACHAAMAVEMVGRQVHQDRRIGLEAWREVDLIGGELEDIDAAGSGRRQLKHRGADVAADMGIEAGRTQ
jgi:hypothetical protein